MLNERHAKWEELHRRGTEPTLELLVRQTSSGAPNIVGSFRLLRLCATFPALARLCREEPYCGWSLTGEDFQRVFTKGAVEEARAKSKAWPFWRGIFITSDKGDKGNIRTKIANVHYKRAPHF